MSKCVYKVPYYFSHTFYIFDEVVVPEIDLPPVCPVYCELLSLVNGCIHY